MSVVQPHVSAPTPARLAVATAAILLLSGCTDGSVASALSVGRDQSCVIYRDEITCGGQEFSQEAPSGDGYVDVSVGTISGCALSGEGYLDCWGDPTQLPGAIPDFGWLGSESIKFLDVEVSADGQACGLDWDGRVWCWSPLNGGEVSRIDMLGKANQQVAMTTAPEFDVCALGADQLVRCFSTQGEPITGREFIEISREGTFCGRRPDLTLECGTPGAPLATMYRYGPSGAVEVSKMASIRTSSGDDVDPAVFCGIEASGSGVMYPGHYPTPYDDHHLDGGYLGKEDHDFVHADLNHGLVCAMSRDGGIACIGGPPHWPGANQKDPFYP